MHPKRKAAKKAAEQKSFEETLWDSANKLCGYGSMSYAGLLSLVYADLKPNDPR